MDPDMEQYIKRGNEDPKPELPPMPDDVFIGLDPEHREWAWAAWHYALDLIDVHLGYLRIASVTGSMEDADAAVRSLARNVSNCMSMLAFPHFNDMKVTAEHFGNAAVSQKVIEANRKTDDFQGANVHEALSAKGWGGYWLEMGGS